MAKVRKKVTRRDIMLAGDAIKRLASSTDETLRARATSALQAFQNKTLGTDDVRFFVQHQLNFMNKGA